MVQFQAHVFHRGNLLTEDTRLTSLGLIPSAGCRLQPNSVFALKGVPSMANCNWTSLRRSFRPAFASSGSQRRRRLGFEGLEDRRVLATLWVDPSVTPTPAIFSSISAAVAAAHSEIGRA